MNRPSYLLFKQCSKCGKIKHISRFYKNKNGKYGVRNDCKECHKKNKKEYYYNNLEYVKKYYEDNKEHYKEYHKEYNKKYYEDNKDKISEYNKQWHKNNPEKLFNKQNRRRSKENTQGKGIDKIQWKEMMDFFDWKCAYSGEKMESNNTTNGRTIDHIVALDNNGENEPWNCVPMRRGYNTSKHTNNMLEWYIKQEYFDIDRLTKIYEWRIYAYWKWYKKGDE